MTNKDVDDSKLCAKCGNFKGLTRYHFCSNCHFKPKRKNSKGSITTNRSSLTEESGMTISIEITIIGQVWIEIFNLW